MNKIDLDGRGAVVTGGAQGFGRAITERFIASGARVAIWDHDQPFAERTAKEIGAGVTAFKVDVSDLAAVEKIRDATLAAFGKHMLGAKSGAIVNVGSMSGFIVNKPQEQSYYNASKAAVHHLTKSLAAEWGARGVRVNAVAPTYLDTPLNAFVKSKPQMYDAWIGGTPMARLGEVDEVASVVLFLASDAASLMTGSVVLVDGGYTCW